MDGVLRFTLRKTTNRLLVSEFWLTAQGIVIISLVSLYKTYLKLIIPGHRRKYYVGIFRVTSNHRKMHQSYHSQTNVAAVRFCGLRFLQAIFTNRTVLRAAEAVFTNVAATARQSHASCDQIPRGYYHKETRWWPYGDRMAPSPLFWPVKVRRGPATWSPW